MNSCTWNGSNWQVAEIWNSSIENKESRRTDNTGFLNSTEHFDTEYRLDTYTMSACENAVGWGFGIREGRDKSKCDGWEWYMDPWIFHFFLSRKIEDNFSGAIEEFLVRAKVVTDGVTGKSLIYSYDFDKENYDIQTRTSMFANATITLPGNSGKVVYKYHNGTYDDADAAKWKGYISIGLKGKIASVINYATGPNETSLGPIVSSTEYLYEAPTDKYADQSEKEPSYYREPDWPSEMQWVRLLAKTQKTDGAEKTIEYGFPITPINSSPTMITTKGDAGLGERVEITFACEKYSQLFAANMLTQVAQQTKYQIENDGTVKLVQSSVTKWDETKLVPKSIWLYETPKEGTADPSFVFSQTTHPPEWKKQVEHTKHSANGLVLETINGSGEKRVSLYGYQSQLPIAVVDNSAYKDCAILSGDYDDNVTVSDIAYFDFGNGWAKVNCILGDPQKKHFGESAISVLPQGKIYKSIASLNASDYIFSAWICPVDFPAGAEAVLSLGDNIKGSGSLAANKWTQVRWEIPKSTIEALASNAQLSVFSKNNANFFVEDIRFYPAGALCSSQFYDKIFKLPTIAVDANDQPSPCSRYDFYGRIKETFKRNALGVETMLLSNEYHKMICNSKALSQRLSRITVNGKLVDLSSGSTTISILVPENTINAEISAVAENPDGSLSINGIESECPCPQDVTIQLGSSGASVSITVWDAYKESSSTYMLLISKTIGCWQEKPTLTSQAVNEHAMAITSGGVPYVGYIDPLSGRFVILAWSGAAWSAVGSGYVSTGKASNIAMCTYSTGIAAVFSDDNYNDRARVIIVNGNTFFDDGLVSSTESYKNAIASYGEGLNIGYLARKNNELDPSSSVKDSKMTAFVKKRIAAMSWTALDNGTGIAVPSGTSDFKLAAGSGNAVYMAYIFEDLEASEELGNAHPDDGSLMLTKYNGTSWQTISAQPVSENSVSDFDLEIIGGIPHVAYCARSSLSLPTQHAIPGGLLDNIHVARFVGGAWENISDNLIPVDAQSAFDIMNYNDNVAIAFSSLFNSYDLSLIEYSNQWSVVGHPIISPNAKGGIFCAGANGAIPHITFTKGVLNGALKAASLTLPCNQPILSNLEVRSLATGNAMLPLFPGFQNYLRNYIINVDFDVAAINVHATGISGTSVTVENQLADANGNRINLMVGWNKIPVRVSTIGNQTPNTYLITIYRRPSAFANICSMNLTDASKNPVNYSPVFSQTIREYSAVVPSDQDGVFFSANGNEGVLIYVGLTILTPLKEKWIPLEFGQNHFHIRVTKGQDLPATNYYLTITRELDPSVQLSTLDFSCGSLSPVFNSAQLSYTIAALSGTSVTQISATATDANSLVYLRNSLLSAAGDQTLNYGNNLFEVVVKNSIGEKATYFIKVTRAPSDEIALDGIVIRRASDNALIALDQSFSSGTYEYKIDSPLLEDCEAITVAITPKIALSQVRVNDEDWAGIPMQILLEPGTNIIPIEITSSDGSTNSKYVLDVFNKQTAESPKISFDKFSSKITEGDYGVRTAKVVVSLSRSPAANVTLNYSVLPSSTAIPGQDGDYQILGGNSLTFTPCDESREILIEIKGDRIIEEDETINISLSLPQGETNAVLGQTTAHTLTIVNDDYPMLQFASASSSVNEYTASKAISISLSANPTLPVEASFIVTGGTATKGTDFSYSSNTVLFNPGDALTKTIIIDIVNDVESEGDETAVFELLNVINAEYGSITKHTLTIVDDDQPFVVEFVATSGSGDESQEWVQIPVTINRLHSISEAPVTVDYTVTGVNGAVAGTDFVLANGQLTWGYCSGGCGTAQNISLQILGDSDYDPGEGVEITLSNPVNASLGEKKTFTYTINDAPPILFTSPTGGQFHIGETVQIQWRTLDPTISSVNLELSMDNGMSWELLKCDASMQNTDSDWENYSWAIPLQTCMSNELSNQSVRIKVSDANNPNANAVSNLIEILETCSNIRYVRANIGTSGSGCSWNTAFKYLQDALAAAKQIGSGITEIHVAAGSYYPDESNANPNGTGLTNSSFKLIPGVSIKGGYPANGGNEEQRNWLINKATLSGDLLENDGTDWPKPQNDNRLSDNCGPLITGSYLDLSYELYLLDGFSIENGVSANGGAMDLSIPQVRILNCTFIHNVATLDGGAVDVTENNILAEFQNCIFKYNRAYGFGGALHARAGVGPLKVVNCLFSYNDCFENGGAIYKDLSSDVILSFSIKNCTFANNIAGNEGGALIAGRTNLNVENSIFFQNDAVYWKDIKFVAFEGTCEVSYCRMQEPWSGSGTNNLTLEPQLSSDFHLISSSSPCYNSGNPVTENSVFLVRDANEIPLDLGLSPRFSGLNLRIDMGAYEFQN